MKKNKDNLESVLRDINKKFGKNAIKLGDEVPDKTKSLFGVSALDGILGGGINIGNFSTIYGAESSGKTTLVYHKIAELQKINKQCVFIDLEKSFDKPRASALGVDVSKLLVINTPKDAEEALDILIKLSDSGEVDFIALDSIHGLMPRGEYESAKGVEKSLGDATMALIPRVLSKFFPKAATSIYQNNVEVLLIGQVRKDLGGFVALDALTGGHALKHWSNFIGHLRRGAKSDAPQEEYFEIKENKKGVETKYKKTRPVGFDAVLKIVKTKLSGSQPEGSDIHLPFYFDSGFIKNEL